MSQTANSTLTFAALEARSPDSGEKFCRAHEQAMAKRFAGTLSAKLVSSTVSGFSARNLSR